MGEPTEDAPAVRKMTGYAFASEELLADADQFRSAVTTALTAWADPNYVPPKPWEGEPLTPKPTAYQELLDEFPAARSTVESALYELLELHGPKPDGIRPDGTVWRWECEGCEATGYEWDYPDWPCETTAVIARHLGVDLS